MVAAKLRTFLCTPNKTLLALPPVAGTLTRGLARFARILAHVLAPQSLALCVKDTSMSNHAQYGFIAILLGLLMCFAYLSFMPKEQALVVNTVNHDRVICGLATCAHHAIILKSNTVVNLNGEDILLSEFISRLGKGLDQCEARTLFIAANPDLDSGLVIELSNLITAKIPDIKIGWGSNDA